MRAIIFLLAAAGLAVAGLATSAPAPLPEGNTGIAARYPGDAGIARDPSVIFASGFESGFDGWTSHNAKVSEIVHDAGLPHGGQACCRTTATRGQDTGGDVVYKLPKGVDRLYLRFYCRFAPETCMPHHFVKIQALRPGFWPNAGKHPPGDKGYWTGIEPTKERTWHFYTYWHKMRSWNNPDGAPNNPPDGTGTSFYGNTFRPDDQTPFEMDRWVCVEAMMKANTVGASDGELAFWIDGKRMGHWRPGEPVGTWIRDHFDTSGPYNKRPAPFEGFDFRSDPTLQLNQIALQWYVSQEVARGAKTDKNAVYFDDVVVATSYIGPTMAP